MEMPRRSGKHGRFLANSSNKVGDEYCEIVCRVIPIMDRLFFKHPKLVVHQVIKQLQTQNHYLIRNINNLELILAAIFNTITHFRHCGIQVQYMKGTLFSSPVIIHCAF